MKEMMQKVFAPIQTDPELKARTLNNLAFAAVPRAHGFLNRGWKRIIAVAAAVLVLSGVITVAGLGMSNTTVAAVSVDINPSIELYVNRFSRVVSAEALNEDGQLILASLDLVNMPVKKAVGDIIAAAAQAGYLAKDGTSLIAITTSTDDMALQDAMERDTEDAAQEALEETDSEASVAHERTGFALVTQARALGITPGRLNLIQKLVALDNTKTVEELVAYYKDARASVIMKDVVALQNLEKSEDKDAAAATRASEKAARESERTTAAATRASEKAARESERNQTTVTLQP